jgi:hypothetical protein
MMTAVIMTTGVMESKEEHWRDGVLEYWIFDVLKGAQCNLLPLLHHSISPTLQA